MMNPKTSKQSKVSQNPDYGAGLASRATYIFSFMDYREYIKAVSDHLKMTKSQFSQRYFARLAGFGSPSYLNMVIKGQRKITLPSVFKFAIAFKLNKKETAYFEALVNYNNAHSEREKERYFLQMIALRPRAILQGIEKDQFEYLTHPYYVVLREMVALPNFQEDPQWIAEHLREQVKVSEVKNALLVLERLKLLVRDKRGLLRHSGTSLEGPVNIPSVQILNYHRQMLSASKEALMAAPYDEWDAICKTIPIPKRLLPQVSEILRRSFDEITDLVNQSGADYHEVFQVNTQIFPFTKTNSAK